MPHTPLTPLADLADSAAPARYVPLAGASNFRDLGGYLGRDGRTVKWRRLFRSDHLAALTPQDQDLLARLGVARSIDFRGQPVGMGRALGLPAKVDAARHAQAGQQVLVLRR